MAHILFTGGGTLGPVTPLLAIGETWRRREPNVRMSWIGTPNGPERVLVEGAKIDFYTLSAPKLDRHRWWKLLLLPAHLSWSLVRSFQLLRQLKPEMVFTAGAYVSAPVVIAAKFLRIPVWVHQLDVVPGVANRLMAPLATKVSVTWPESVKLLRTPQALVVGAMARKGLTIGTPEIATDRYGFYSAKPTLLVTGGGTGAASLNEAMTVAAAELAQKMNVLHVTGKGKMLAALQDVAPTYMAVEFLADGMADAYAAADIVLTRAGMGTIAELAALGKAAILVPLPGTSQVTNAAALVTREAAEVVTMLTPQTLIQAVEHLLVNPARREALAHHIRSIFPLNGDERIVHEASTLLTTP